MNTPPRWARPPADELVWETFGEANFVYHVASGQTHFLNELGAWILRCIERNARTTDEICDDIVTSFDAEASPELVESVQATIQVLAGLGLIVRGASA